MIQCTIRFSGITVRFHVPDGTQFHEEMLSLRCEDAEPDEEFTIRLLDKPLNPVGSVLYSNSGITEYETDAGRLRIYHALVETDGCQVACLLCPDGKNIMYYPASRWAFYASPLRLIHLIMPELLLMRHDGFLLHSSVVGYHGTSLLFSGASGAGKSTQAALWEKYMGADVVNGDRCLIRKIDGRFFGGGSPWSGTSGIYHPEFYPISAVVLPYKASENRISLMGASAFPLLLAQTVVNHWNSPFMEKLTQMYSELMVRVPVYRLDCRPDEEAVRLVHRTVFGKDE